MVFSGVDLELEHLGGLDWVGASVSYAEFIFFVWEYLALSEVANGYLEIVFCQISQVSLSIFVASFCVLAVLGVLLVIDEVNQNIVAFQIVVSHVVRVDRPQGFQNLVENRYVEAQVLPEHLDGAALLAPPVAEGASVLFHYDVVGLPVDSVVVKICDAFLESELFQTSDLCEYVMKHASVGDVAWHVHLLDGHWIWRY